MFLNHPLILSVRLGTSSHKSLYEVTFCPGHTPLKMEDSPWACITVEGGGGGLGGGG